VVDGDVNGDDASSRSEVVAEDEAVEDLDSRDMAVDMSVIVNIVVSRCDVSASIRSEEMTSIIRWQRHGLCVGKKVRRQGKCQCQIVYRSKRLGEVQAEHRVNSEALYQTK